MDTAFVKAFTHADFQLHLTFFLFAVEAFIFNVIFLSGMTQCTERLNERKHLAHQVLK